MDDRSPPTNAHSVLRRPLLQVLLLLVLWFVMGYLWWPAAERFLPVPGVFGEIPVNGVMRSFYVYLPSGIHPLRKLPTIFFLQGLDTPENPSGQTRQFYRFITRKAEQYKFIAVFPRGWLNSYPQAAGTLAWYPEYFFDNHRFLMELSRFITKRFPVDARNLLFAGFSNAGYFGGCEALFYRHSPFTGFWLDGGAYPYGRHGKAPRRRIFLTVGENDRYNREHVENFARYLLNEGWVSGKNLLMKKHPGAHTLCESEFDRLWTFLVRDFDEKI
jgi:predicted esterase